MNGMTHKPAAASFPLRGVYAAAVTPLTASLEPDLAALPRLLDFLAGRGCHGVLLLGTTGEGPSFSLAERQAILAAALRHRDQAQPALKIMAGTGCANLAETIELTRAAFALGADGAVVLPAFYYKGVAPAGLADYFQRLAQAVPADGRALLLYHIPQVSGVGVPAETVAHLLEQLPERAWGMKDSQDDLEHTLALTRQFPGLGVFAGSDSIMSPVLAEGAAGTITALANVVAPLNRAVWDAHQRGEAAPEAQARLVRARQAIKGLSGPAALKAALADLFGFPLWPVRPPLQPLPAAQRAKLCAELAALLA